MSISLKDIAAECGVSVSTVSRALAEPACGRMGAATRKRIKECAAKHGFAVNSTARILRTRRHKALTLVVPGYFSATRVSVDFDAQVRFTHWELINAATDRLHDNGYDVKIELMQTENWQALLPKLNSNHSDGAILLGTVCWPELMEHMDKQDFPYISLSFSSTAFDAMLSHSITPGIAEAVAHLHRTGCRNAGICMTPGMHADVMIPEIGRVLDKFTMFSPDNIFMIADNPAIRRLLAQNAFAGCDALFCGNDTIAFHLQRECAIAGVPVPERLQLIGYDNNPLHPDISTIAVPRCELATKAVDMLLAALRENHMPDKNVRICLPSRFIGRSTTVPEVH